MGKRNLKAWVFLLMMAFVLTSGGCGGSSGGGANFAGGSGTSADPWQIATAEQLDEVHNHLGGHFVLTSDIDLASYDNWEPIGVFVPASEKEEDAETPAMELAFTGVFNGGGHTISNVTINAPEGAGVGLFGCVAGDTGSVLNLSVSNANVTGIMLVGGVVGYGAGSTVKNVQLKGSGNSIAGYVMVGGIVGGGFCDIIDCKAEATVELVGDSSPDNPLQCVGVLAGGMETSDIMGSSAKGSVIVKGKGIGGIGGLAGCAHESSNVLDCESDVVMTVGENSAMIGGLIGYAGKSEGEPTLISGCAVNAVITAPDSAERIGGIVGGGAYWNIDEYKEIYPEPTAIKITNCGTSGRIDISGGGTVSTAGTIIGYAYNNSSVAGSESDMTVNGAASKQIGATLDDVALDELR
jgi:hypothetical protein